MSRRERRWLALYTEMYLCVVAVLGLLLLRYHRTLLWYPDGIKQPYTVVGYVGRIVRGLLAGHGWPMLDFSLGQGMDVLTTCTYYGYTDPLTFLGAFFSGDGVELAYGLISVLRMYLTGATMGLYLKRLRLQGWAIACGAAIYAFQGFVFHMLGVHPYFINGALYLPLMLLGVECTLDAGKWQVFSLTVALMLIVNFYFAFMNTMVTIIYIIVRLVFRLPGAGVRRGARDGFTLLGAYLLGAALSAVVFIPVVYLYLSNSRLGIDAGYSGSMLHYGRKYYLGLIEALFAPWKGPMGYTWPNFAPLALFGLLALLFRRGRFTPQLFILLGLSLLGLCIPMAGYIMNGMAYVSNRWSYAVGFFVAIGSAAGLSSLFQLKRIQRRWIVMLALVFAGALFALGARRNTKLFWVAPLLIILTGLLLWAYDSNWLRGLTRRRMRALLCGSLACCCALYLFIGFAPRGYGNIRSRMRTGVYTDVASKAAGQYIEDDGVYRVGQSFYDDAQSPMLGYMGTSYYWSLVDDGASDYYQELFLPTQSTTWHVWGLGGSAEMNAVAAVKYITQQQGVDWVIPYGFEESDSLELPDGSCATVYENKNALPLGYAYDQVMSRAEYAALSVEDKLQALTEYAICDEYAPSTSGFESMAKELPYTVTEETTVDLRDGWIGARKDDVLSLRFDAPEDCETYLIIEGLEAETATVGKTQRSGVTVVSEAGSSIGNVSNPRSNFYFPRKGHAFCLGSEALTKCEIRFMTTTNYTFRNMRIVSVPMEGYRNSTACRRSEGLTDVRLGNDSLSGTIKVEGDRVLQLAVPYSRGWRAWVDGAEQPVFRCGELYMGIVLDAGEHAIEMQYVTPGIRIGAVISLLALALLIGLSIVFAWRGRKNNEE